MDLDELHRAGDLAGLLEAFHSSRYGEAGPRDAAAASILDLASRADVAAVAVLISALHPFAEDTTALVEAALRKRFAGPETEWLVNRFGGFGFADQAEDERVTQALIQSNDGVLPEALIAALGSKTADLWVRQAAARALADLRYRGAVGPLLAALRDEDYERVDLEMYPENWGRQVPPASEWRRHPVRAAAASALRAIGGAEAEQALAEFYSRAD